jgi:TetR/AcrR family fatty acid metabolism transcriptional regulator
MRFLIYRHLSLYAENPDYANIVMLILKGHRNFQKTAAYKSVQSAARITIQVLEEGVQKGEFRPDIQPLLVRAIIWGTIEHLVTRKCLLGKPDDLLGLADDIITTIFKGIVVPKKEPTLNLKVNIEDNLKPKGGRS